MKHIKSFIQLNESSQKDLLTAFANKLKSSGLTTKSNKQEIIINKDNKPIGELRCYIQKDLVVMEMIYLDKEYQKKGIGTKIYQALFDSAIETGLKGLYSYTFDSNTGQQRSEAATALLNKLIKTNGGTIYDVDEEEPEYGDIPHHGPPFQDFKIDGSGSIKRVDATT